MEMLTAADAERAAVELRIPRVRFGNRLSHRGCYAALDVRVRSAHGPHEAFGAFLVGQHEVTRLLAGWFDLAQARRLWIGGQSHGFTSHLLLPVPASRHLPSRHGRADSRPRHSF